MARDVLRRLLWVLGLSAAAAIVRFGRRQLIGVEDPVMPAWPGQVIFGLYFTIIVVAAQSLFAHFSASPRRGSPEQRLALLVLVGVSLDLVLVNVQEVVARVDASYGLVVLWDVVTFFVWMRAADLARPGEEEAFRLSAAAISVPVFKLGREILFLPYPDGFFRAYLDLWVGDALLCIWAFVTLRATRESARVEHVATVARVVVFGICCYWLCNAVENTLFLAWPPLSRALESGLQSRDIPPGAVGVTYIVIATVITAVVWHTDVKGLGTAFGVQRRRAA
jgi:hypothetical protein